MVLINQKHINKCNQNKHELDDGTKFIVINFLHVLTRREKKNKTKKKQDKKREIKTLEKKILMVEKKINKNEKKQPKHTKKK